MSIGPVETKREIGAVANAPYRPPNAYAGCDFDDMWCAHCTRDKAFRDGGPDADPALGCQILADSYAYPIDHPSYPKEWIEDDRGPRCTAFTEDPTCPVRCDRTIDMFSPTRGRAA